MAHSSRIVLLAILLSAASFRPSTAAPGDLTRSAAGHTYFHRSGASWQAHVDAVRYCADKADKMTPLILSGYSSGSHGVLGNILESGFHSMHKRRAMATNIENCMVVKGWSVVRLEDSAGTELAALDAISRVRRLQELVGADVPVGEIVRRYTNEAADNRTRMWSDPGDLDKASLSVEAVRSVSSPEASTPAVMGAATTPSIAPKKPIAASRLDQIGTIPDGHAVVLLGLADPQRKEGVLRFLRATGDNPAADRLPDEFVAKIGGAIWSRPREKTEAFIVPAGRWRLTHRSNGLETVSFCLGAPTFEIGAGEIVYAGRFDVSGPGIFGPHFGWTPTPTELARFPVLGRPLRDARFEGRDETICWGSYLYALDVPAQANVPAPPAS